MKPRLGAGLLLAGLVELAGLSAQPETAWAVTVTFDFRATDELSLTEYTEDGMTFSTPTAHFHNLGAGTADVLYFHSHGGDSFLVMSLGGAPFDLISLDVALVTSFSSSTLPTLTASNGSVVGAPWTMGTFVFPVGWAGITSVVWRVEDPVLGSETMAIDNLVFSSAVLVLQPASLFLVGAGLTAMAAVRRPKRTSGGLDNAEEVARDQGRQARRPLGRSRHAKGH